MFDEAATFPSAVQRIDDPVELPFHRGCRVGSSRARLLLSPGLCQHDRARDDGRHRSDTKYDRFHFREQHGSEYSFSQRNDRGRANPGRGGTSRDAHRGPDSRLDRHNGQGGGAGFAKQGCREGDDRQGQPAPGEAVPQLGFCSCQPAGERSLGNPQSSSGFLARQPSSSQSTTAPRYRTGSRATSSSRIARSSAEDSVSRGSTRAGLLTRASLALRARLDLALPWPSGKPRRRASSPLSRAGRPTSPCAPGSGKSPGRHPRPRAHHQGPDGTP